MTEPTPSQEIILLGLTAQKGEPSQIIASIEERKAEYLGCAEATESAKAAVARYADKMIAKVRAGELPLIRTVR